jgi:aspartyl/asparaginyl beta-hydroxylase (cupin superfamily)
MSDQVTQFPTAFSSPPPATLSADQIAELMQYNVEHFRQIILPKLLKQGFPDRLPGMARWSRRAVMAWIDQQVGGQDIAS